MIKGIQQVQLSTVIKNDTVARNTLATVSTSGFEGIELNSFMINKLPLSIRVFTKLAGMPMGQGSNLDWVSLLKEYKLKVISLHTDLGALLNRSDEVIEMADKYNTDYVVLTGMYHFDYSDLDAVNELIENLNTAGKNMSKGNKKFLYHNHNCEFLNVDSNHKAYDLIIDNTDSDYVNFEFDSYWAAEAGIDVREMMERLGNRMRLWHICDRGNRAQGKASSILKTHEMELGTGNMNLDELYRIAEKNKCEAVILEQHKDYINKDVLESIKISGKWLKEK